MKDLPPTQALYLEDSMQDTMDSKVLAHSSFGKRPSLILEQTIFYPEGGGQAADRGELSGCKVLNVQKDEHGLVHHILDGPLPEADTMVSGRLDMPWRLRNMAQHTGQHMLSQALLSLAQARTVSSHLGQSQMTVDVAQADLTWSKVREAEALVNRQIERDLAIRAWYPSEQELASLPIRRRPKVNSQVRLVAIADFDLVPCGGTHCTHSSQVGLLLALHVERYKGMSRVTFVAGPRARELARIHRDTVHSAGQTLACAPEDVARRVEQSCAQSETRLQDLLSLQKDLARAKVQELLGQAQGPTVVAELDPSSAPLLRRVAKGIAKVPHRAAVLIAAQGDSWKLSCIRGQSCDLDCGQLVRKLAEQVELKGGGRPDNAEAVIRNSAAQRILAAINSLIS